MKLVFINYLNTYSFVMQTSFGLLCHSGTFLISLIDYFLNSERAILFKSFDEYFFGGTKMSS